MAMHRIGPYVRRHPNDVEALLAYTQAREHVREPNRKHIIEALVLYRRVLSFNPRHIPAAESLLRLYQEHALWTEALQSANDLLAIDEKNKAAMQGRAASLLALGRFANDEAYNAALTDSNTYPGEMAGQLLTQEVLRRSDNTHQRALQHREALRKKHPGDARFILLTGIANACIGDAEAGREWLDQACQKEMPDPVALGALVEYCDRVEMFEASLAALQRHGNKGGEFSLLLTRRLWELERHAELVQQVGNSESADSVSAAFACLSLHRLGKKEEAANRAKALAAKAQDDPAARAWSPMVDALIGKEVPD